MQLRIEENDFGTCYYDQYLVINGVRKEFQKEEFALLFEEEFEEDELEVSVHFQNRFLQKDKKGKCLLYLLAVAERLNDGWSYSRFGTGMGLGKPYDALLSFTCKGTESIRMHTNEFSAKEPFTIYGKQPLLQSNCFYAEQGAKMRWFLWSELIRCCLSVLLLGVFLLMFLTAELAGKILMGLLLSFSFLFVSSYGVYLWRLLHRH